MGCVPSRSARERLETSTIDAILQDDDFVKQLLVSTPSLSRKSQENLCLLAQTVQCHPRKDSIVAEWSSHGCSPATTLPVGDAHSFHLLKRKDLQKFLTLKEADISLHDLLPYFDRWKLEPGSFFEAFDMRRDGDPALYLARQCHNVSLSKSNLIVDRIRRRFFVVFFFKARNLPLEHASLDRWIAYGQKYSRLASLLGIGCLFLLPAAIPDSVWEDRLPIKGHYIGQAVELLKQLRIAEKVAQLDANRIGDTILEYLIQPLRSDLPDLLPNIPTSEGVVIAETRRQAGRLPTRPVLHLPSEQVFYRVPIITPYDSPIFICVQSGNIAGMRELWRLGLASIDAVDPYGLGLLYYSAYYCWRNCGTETAMATCKALLEAGANHEWRDEIGNTPMETMIDTLLAESARDGRSFNLTLSDVGQLFGRPLDDLWREYSETRGFTEVHQVLLRLGHGYGTLNDYLNRAAAEGIVSDRIDATDSLGRSALSWAVEHGWAYAAETLIRFGANVHQRTRSIYGGLPMLHVALAGPTSGNLGAAFLDIVKMLILAGANVNATDHEGWTPLHIAASWNSYAAIRTLLEYSGQSLNWDAVTSSGQSASQIAAESGGDEALIELLDSRELHWPRAGAP